MEQLSKVDKIADKPLQWPGHYTAVLIPGLREVGDNLREGRGGGGGGGGGGGEQVGSSVKKLQVCLQLTASVLAMARWEGGEFWRDMTRYLFSNPSRTISCSVSGASSPDHNVMLPSNCGEEGGSTPAI